MEEGIEFQHKLTIFINTSKKKFFQKVLNFSIWQLYLKKICKTSF